LYEARKKCIHNFVWETSCKHNIKCEEDIKICLGICYDHLTWIILAEKNVTSLYLVAFSPRVILYYRKVLRKHYKENDLLELCIVPASVPTVKYSIIGILRVEYSGLITETKFLLLLYSLFISANIFISGSTLLCVRKICKDWKPCFLPIQRTVLAAYISPTITLNNCALCQQYAAIHFLWFSE
jgi:hypothetical protein